MLNNTVSQPTLLRRKAVECRTGLSRSSIYQKMANGHFPKPVALGPRSVAWLDSTINEWIAERVRASVE